jgi:thiamine biosynthesis protein ThiI
MDHVLVRYGEIGTKSEPVRSRMLNTLRQRVEDRLEYEEMDFKKVVKDQGRIFVEKVAAREAAKKISELPGVASASPAEKIESDIKEMKKTTENLEVGDTFGVRASRAGDHEFKSSQVEREVGHFIREEKSTEVDLDDPDTWVKFDIRFADTYVFTERFEGPGGFPVGTGDPIAALISGGIDSPIAARKMMNRGSDVLPVYFYNRPVAAEDHLFRFKAVLDELEKLHPSKDWNYYIVDLKEINEQLMEIGRGRMILHRQLMFRVAERLAEEEGLEGIVTGESASQKSSQTVSNLRETSQTVDMPVFRPLLTRKKSEITEEARELDTFKHSKIDSACRSLSPENPATRIDSRRISNLKEGVKFEKLVEKAVEKAEKNQL